MKAHIDKVTKASQDEIAKKINHLASLIKHQGRDAGKDEPLLSNRSGRRQGGLSIPILDTR